MIDRYTEVTRTSWGSRVRQSLFGALIGGLMFLGSFALLWWNEGRAIDEARALEEGAGAVIDAGIEAVDPQREGKLLHVTGTVDARAKAQDPAIGLSVDALGLRRIVEMYQWVESRKSEERKKLGGGSETVTVYEYTREWREEPVESSRFRHPETHENPRDWPIRSDRFSAGEVTLGAFVLAEPVREAIGRWQDLPMQIAAQLPEQFGEFRRVGQGMLYRGADPDRPQVGDLRVRYEYQPEATYSIVARQRGSMLDRYVAANGREVLLVEEGVVPAAEMFADAQSRNRLITWLVRLGGALLMWMGLAMVFAPISRILDVLPILGTISSWGIGLVTGLIALLLSLTTIGIAWVFYRPLLGGAILLGVVVLFFWSRRTRKPAAVVPVAPPPPPAP